MNSVERQMHESIHIGKDVTGVPGEDFNGVGLAGEHITVEKHANDLYAVTVTLFTKQVIIDVDEAREGCTVEVIDHTRDDIPCEPIEASLLLEGQEWAAFEIEWPRKPIESATGEYIGHGRTSIRPYIADALEKLAGEFRN